MKKYIFLLLISFPNEIFSQAAYMHEAAEDARNTHGLGLLDNLLFYLTFGVIIFVIIAFAISWFIAFVKKSFNGEEDHYQVQNQRIATKKIKTEQKVFHKGWAVLKLTEENLHILIEMATI